MAQQVECLPLAQGMVLESHDQVPHQAPCMEPASPSAYVLSLIHISEPTRLEC